MKLEDLLKGCYKADLHKRYSKMPTEKLRILINDVVAECRGKKIDEIKTERFLYAKEVKKIADLLEPATLDAIEN